MRTQFLILIIIFSFYLSPAHAIETDPTIDGIVSEGEWDGGFIKDIEMTNGRILTLTAYYSETHMFFLAEIPHNAPDDVIEFNLTEEHDYFGIEFDVNDDGVVMGTINNPDDMVIVDYIEKGGVDMYSTGIRAGSVKDDVINGGVDDALGASGSDAGVIFWEIMKPLDSGDTGGHDVSLKNGDTFFLMPAFWDSKFPHSAAEYIPKLRENTQFIKMRVGGPADEGGRELIGVASLVVLIGAAVIYMTFGRGRGGTI
ncbi:MAG: hypothetical protein ACXAB7_11255 [Candidatus Kariarchaeaceae archaeon]|jgi:hypothetical protein